MAATYEPIATTTLASTQATITFSSIPSTYTDLILVMQPRAVSSGETVIITFNNNSSNYSQNQLFGDGTTTGSSRYTSAAYIKAGNTVVQNTYGSISTVHIMNYANTSTNKNVLYRFGNSALGTEAGTGMWANTSAINRIDIKLTGGVSYNTNSTFTLYGILKG